MYRNPIEDAIPFGYTSSLTEIPQDNLKVSNLDIETKEEWDENLHVFPDESKTILVFEPPFFSPSTSECVLTRQKESEEIDQPQLDQPQPQLLAANSRVCILESNKKSPGPQSKTSKRALE